MQLQTDLGWFLSQKSHDVSSHPTSPQLLSVWGTSAPRHHGDRVAVPHGVCVCMCVRLRLCACEREISQSQAGHRQWLVRALSERATYFKLGVPPVSNFSNCISQLQIHNTWLGTCSLESGKTISISRTEMWCFSLWTSSDESDANLKMFCWYPSNHLILELQWLFA